MAGAFVDHSDLVAVLKIAPNAVERDAHVDAVSREFVRRAHARQHEKLRRVEGASGQNDLAPRKCATQRAEIAGGLRACPIEVASPAVFDADRAEPLVEQDASCEGVELDAQAMRIHRLCTRSRAPRRRPRDVDIGASVRPSASRPCRRRSFGSSSPIRKRGFRSIRRSTLRSRRGGLRFVEEVGGYGAEHRLDRASDLRTPPPASALRRRAIRSSRVPSG